MIVTGVFDGPSIVIVGSPEERIVAHEESINDDAKRAKMFFTVVFIVYMIGFSKQGISLSLYLDYCLLYAKIGNIALMTKQNNT